MANTVPSPTGAAAPAYGNSQVHPKAGFWALTIGSIGVVYGDIGTSPLYAVREAVVAAVGANGTITRGSRPRRALADPVVAAHRRHAQVRRSSSCARTTTARAARSRSWRSRSGRSGRPSLAIFLLGVIGAALFYGDAMITPALSVLSAVEGLKIATPAFEPYVVPLTVADPGSALHGAVARHRQRRRFLRADHRGMVRRHRRRWRREDRGESGRARGGESDLCAFVSREPRRHRAGDARRGVPRGHRRRGALCGPRAFRPAADPGGVARVRLSGAAHQLFRAGRAAAWPIQRPSRIHSF